MGLQPVEEGELVGEAVGADPGASKLSKAEELGVPILDEAAFAELLDTGQLPS